MLDKLRARISNFMCDTLGWHKPGKYWMSGINLVSNCRYCGRKILKDSQGNWFGA